MNGAILMATNGINVPTAQTLPTATRQRKFQFSSVAIRVLIALLISWLIVMAFFVTGAVSH